MGILDTQYTTEQYKKMVMNLLPLGEAWPRAINSQLYNFFSGFAPELNRFDSALMNFVRNTYPVDINLDNFLGEWEKDLAIGSSGSCYPSSVTDADRRTWIRNRLVLVPGLVADHGASVRFFYYLADLFGVQTESDTVQSGGSDTITLASGASASDDFYNQMLVLASGFETGTSQGGGLDKIQLASGSLAVDNVYNNLVITITSGTGSGQTNTGIAYVGSTRQLQVLENWTTQPDATSVYSIALPDQDNTITDYNGTTKIATCKDDWKYQPDNTFTYKVILVQILVSEAFTVSGTAQAGGASSITLTSGSLATDDVFNLMMIVITGGTGQGQDNIITDYNGTTKIADVLDQWDTVPDATSTYDIQKTPISECGVSECGYSACGGESILYDWTVVFQDATDSGLASCIIHSFIPAHTRITFLP